MADELTDSQVATFNSVLNGSMLNALRGLKNDLATLRQKRVDLSYKPGTSQAALRQMDSSILAMQNNLNVAIENHNKLAGWIQTATGQNIGLAGGRGLGALGVIPAIVYTVAAIAGGLIALSLVLDKLATAFAAAQGKSIETKGIIDQVGGAITSATGLITTVLIGAAILGAGYLTYRILQKRGVLA